MADEVKALFSGWMSDELRALPPDQQARVVRRVSLLERKGWSASVRSRDVVHLEDEIWELRVVGKGPAYRLLFFVVEGSVPRIVVLTGCVGKSVMKKPGLMALEVARAERRRREWLFTGKGSMRGDRTTAEMVAELSRDPEFAAAWALSQPKIAVAVNVSRLREERGLTQAQLAEAVGRKQPRIAEIERGDANPTLETLTRIALALRVPLAALFADAADAAVPARASARLAG
ncbi:MAG TPA: helix-turn-helix domain-containing protein [Longimicrobium sp.]|nr:helix-turn-helix domain-containing protein [Longimicrobium sp.]